MEAHALSSDLDAVRDRAAHPGETREADGRAALAIYEDVCWRLALVQFPQAVLNTVLEREREAAGLLRGYLGGALARGAFWQGFEGVVAALDTLTATVEAQAQDELEASCALKAMRAEVARAGLPPTVRRQVQTLLDVMAEALYGYHAGKLAAADFWRLFEQGRDAFADAVAGAQGLAPGSAVERLHQAATAALSADAPDFMRVAIAHRLVALAEAWDAGEDLDAAALTELEALLERAGQFQAAHGAAEARFRAQSAAVTQQPLPTAIANEAEDQLSAMRALLAALEGGRLEPDTFTVRFEVAAHRIDQLLHVAGAERAELFEAVALLDEARARVAAASLPRFVAVTAHDLLGAMARTLADGAPDDASWAEFRACMQDLSLCLAFGAEVVHEKTEALRRFEGFERRLAGRALHPMLRGPVADLLETLRGLLHRLEGGLFPLLEFHRAFEEVGDRLEKLLVWQTALEAPAPARTPDSAQFHHPEA